MEHEDTCSPARSGTWPHTDRREKMDRRARPTPFLSKYLGWGRRARGRRKGEAQNIYVDRFSRLDSTVAVGIIILNVLDAIFTLVYLHHGGEEANPIARYIIYELGVGWFIFSKAVVIGICVLFLTIHKTFRHVRLALYALLGFYSVLLFYHLYLQAGLWGLR